MNKTNLSDLIRKSIEKSLDIGLKKETEFRGTEKFDYFCENNKHRVFVEIELKREDPVNNIAKAWRQLDTIEKDDKKSFFIHVFSASYSESNRKYLNATFIGRKLEESGKAKYIPILIPIESPKNSKGIFKINENDKRKVENTIHTALFNIQL